MKVSFLSICFLFTLSLSDAYAQYAKIDSLEQQLASLKSTDTLQVRYLLELSELYKKVNPDSTWFRYGIRARDLSRNLSYDQGLVETNYYLGKELAENNPLKGIEYYQEAQRLAEKTANHRYLYLSTRAIGFKYFTLGYNAMAVEALLRALDMTDGAWSTPQEKAKLMSILGAVYLRLDEKNETLAIDYQLKALDILEEIKDEKEIAFARNNLADSYYSIGKYDESLREYTAALALFEKLDNKFMIGWVFSGLGEVYLVKGDAERARTLYTRQLNIVKDNPFERAVALIGIGKAESLSGNYKQAIPIFEEAIALLRPLKSYSVESSAVKGLAEAAEKSGDYKTAFENHRIYAAYQDTLNTRKNHKKTAEMQYRYEHEKASEQIALLEKEKKLNQLTIAFLGVVLALVAISVALFVARWRLRVQKDRVLRQTENEKLQAQLQANQLTEEHLRTELGYRAKALTTFTLNMVHKNEILEDVKREVEEIKKSADEETKSKLNKLASRIHLSYQLDKDWDNFRKYFDQVHPAFFENLKKAFPDLNANEVKLCALLRLNLDNKQIAIIMDISPESAKVARHRLRKKLGITVEQDLGIYFEAFEPSIKQPMTGGSSLN